MRRRASTPKGRTIHGIKTCERAGARQAHGVRARHARRVAGAILRSHLQQANGDLTRGVGNHHSRMPELHGARAARVLAATARLFGANRGADAR